MTWIMVKTWNVSSQRVGAVKKSGGERVRNERWEMVLLTELRAYGDGDLVLIPGGCLQVAPLGGIPLGATNDHQGR